MIRARKRELLACALATLLLAVGCSGGGGGDKSDSGDAAAAPAKAPHKSDPGDVSAGNAATAGYTPSGKLIADNGFRPEKDGFSFENYGGALPPDPTKQNLGPNEMRKLFGDAVCDDAKSGKCDLTPPAQQWMDQFNKSMDGGHCQGFSVLSGLLWKRIEQPNAFGADATPALSIDNNDPLQREIAYAFAYQGLDSYNNAIVKGTPNDILDKLIEVLHPDNPDTYTIGIYKRGFQGGHAVTPFAVEDDGGGIFKILIYDNNFPGVTRAITVDRNKNAWSYDAATNPQNPSELYEGDADSKTIDVEPTSPGQGVQPCPFCGNLSSGGGGSKGSLKGAAATGPDLDLVWLDGSDVDHAHLLITDPQGHRLGYVNGNIVSEIPGGRAAFNKASQDWNETPEPDFYVPDGVDYTITVDGTQLEEADDTTVGIIGPAWDVTVDDLEIQKGERATIHVAKDATNVSFTSNKAQKPTIDIGTSDEVDYEFEIAGATIKAGATFSADLPLGSSDMTFTDTPGASYDFSFDRTDDDGQISFAHKGISLGNGDKAVFHYGPFNSHDDPVTVDVTHGGSTKAQQLSNEAS